MARRRGRRRQPAGTSSYASSGESPGARPGSHPTFSPSCCAGSSPRTTPPGRPTRSLGSPRASGRCCSAWSTASAAARRRAASGCPSTRCGPTPGICWPSSSSTPGSRRPRWRFVWGCARRAADGPPSAPPRRRGGGGEVGAWEVCELPPSLPGCRPEGAASPCGARSRSIRTTSRSRSSPGGADVDGESVVPPAGRGERSRRGGSAERDVAEEVLFGADALKDAPPGDLLAAAHGAGLEVARLPALVPAPSPRRDRSALHTLTRLLAEGEFDIVHTHTAKAGALARTAAARVGVPRIVHTFHGFPFHEFQPRWRRTAYVQAERWLGRRTDVFLAVGSAVAAEAVRRKLATAERMRTIPAAVDPVSYPSRDQARRRLGLPSGVPLVGTVGRVDHQKAPEDFVAAVAEQNDDVFGVWIGDGPLRERMLARVRRFGIQDRFCWLGHRDDVAELLPAFDVFALASRYEGVPCVLIEAAVPLVATAVNAVSDVVVPGETGLLVPPGQPRQLAAAIGYLLDRPAEGRRMAEGARAWIGDRFTPQALGAVLADAYRGPQRRP
ncbi:MAG: glycosyltransferase [Streptosporangiales bacterium]|nr:glycosyltransferase [Streptosporangiales bacterium]